MACNEVRPDAEPVKVARDGTKANVPQAPGEMRQHDVGRRTLLRPVDEIHSSADAPTHQRHRDVPGECVPRHDSGDLQRHGEAVGNPVREVEARYDARRLDVLALIRDDRPDQLGV